MELEVDAVYEDGHFRLLEPITLKEGERVVLNIIRERDRFQEIMNGLLAQESDDENEEGLDEDFEPIVVDWGDGPTASEIIIQERD